MSDQPIYRKWWAWVIGAVVLFIFFGNQEEAGAPQPVSSPVAEVSVVVEGEEEVASNSWSEWWTINEDTWNSLVLVLTDTETNGIDYTFNKAIEYAESITPLPDAVAQAIFDEYIENMKASQLAWNNGDIVSANSYIEDATQNIVELTQFINNSVAV